MNEQFILLLHQSFGNFSELSWIGLFLFLDFKLIELLRLLFRLFFFLNFFLIKLSFSSNFIVQVLVFLVQNAYSLFLLWDFFGVRFLDENKFRIKLLDLFIFFCDYFLKVSFLDFGLFWVLLLLSGLLNQRHWGHLYLWSHAMNSLLVLFYNGCYLKL